MKTSHTTLLAILAVTACRDHPPKTAGVAADSGPPVPAATTDSCTLPKFKEPAVLPGFKDYFIQETEEVSAARRASMDTISPIGWVYLNSYGPGDFIGVEMPIVADTTPAADTVAYLDYYKICNGGGSIIHAVRLDSIYTYHTKVTYEEWGWFVRQRVGDWVKVIYAFTVEGLPLHGWARLNKDIVMFTDVATEEEQ